MPYKDARRTHEFYNAVFGWKTELLVEEMGRYILATTAENDVKSDAPAGAINGGFFPYKDEDGFRNLSIVIGVDNLEDTMYKIIANGGQVIGEPHDIPGIGRRYISFMDTEDNRNSILQPIRDH